jgi:hypothetical protein
MMYAMYFKQPCMPRVKFRLKPEEFRDMWALMEEAQRDHHYDVLYAWAKVETRVVDPDPAFFPNCGSRSGSSSESRVLMTKN